MNLIKNAFFAQGLQQRKEITSSMLPDRAMVERIKPSGVTLNH